MVFQKGLGVRGSRGESGRRWGVSGAEVTSRKPAAVLGKDGTSGVCVLD